MKIRLGKDQVGLLNPPNEGEVWDKQDREWIIRRTGSGNIILSGGFFSLHPGEPHPEFLPDGKDLQSFCQWINDQL